MWNKIYGGTDGEWGHSVIQTSDGRYAIAGYTHYSYVGGNDVFWLRLMFTVILVWRVLILQLTL
jgi:hypothetical protein